MRLSVGSRVRGGRVRGGRVIISWTLDAVTGSSQGRMSFHEAKKMPGAPTWVHMVAALGTYGYSLGT